MSPRLKDGIPIECWDKLEEIACTSGEEANEYIKVFQHEMPSKLREMWIIPYENDPSEIDTNKHYEQIVVEFENNINPIGVLNDFFGSPSRRDAMLDNLCYFLLEGEEIPQDRRANFMDLSTGTLIILKIFFNIHLEP
jgi:hypothetical protein